MCQLRIKSHAARVVRQFEGCDERHAGETIACVPSRAAATVVVKYGVRRGAAIDNTAINPDQTHSSQSVMAWLALRVKGQSPCWRMAYIVNPFPLDEFKEYDVELYSRAYHVN